MVEQVLLSNCEGQYGIQRAVEILCAGGACEDAIEEAIKLVESDERAKSVGRGGAPNMLGVMECDASFMRGSDRMVGCVASISGVKHPISCARKVMEVLPHVLLTGAGANLFADEMGLEKDALYSDESQRNYARWLHEKAPDGIEIFRREGRLHELVSFKTMSNMSLGTVVMLGRDCSGRLFGGVSTSGWAYKYPGRSGDSPIIGAGLYVDDRFGAAACTHTGEMTIRGSAAHSVVMLMRAGLSVEAAVKETLDDLAKLTGGYLGPVIIHAMSKDGETFVGTHGGHRGDRFCLWREGDGAVQLRDPLICKP